MSSPVFLHLREVECWRCGVNRLDDGTRCKCGVYQNKNIQLVDGKWRDVRYIDRQTIEYAEPLTKRLQ